MSEHLFGPGPGYLPKRADAIARHHGAVLVNHCDPGCQCGHGCTDDCPAGRRHWFAGPNRGEPFDSAMSRSVMADLAAAKIES